MTDEQHAVDIAKQAFGIEEQRLRNYYLCVDCDHEWIDYWSCAVDDECPQCGVVHTPYSSVDLDE